MLNLPEQKDTWKIPLSAALLIDGINMFHAVFVELVTAYNELEIQHLSCQDTASWKYGSTVANQIKGVSKSYSQQQLIRKTFNRWSTTVLPEKSSLTLKASEEISSWT